MRTTKIIATIGPACSDSKTLAALLKAGVNVFRLNFSHGSHDSHKKTIDLIRVLQKEHPSLSIILDTKGPEVRTIDVSSPLQIRRGELVAFTAKKHLKTPHTTVIVDHSKFAHDCKSAQCILVDNGEMRFTIKNIEKDYVLAQAEEDGSIGSRRHVNLPGAHLSLPSFTEKDLADIAFGCKNNVDFFALSFVRSAADIRSIRTYMEKHGSSAEIIAKIETAQAVENLEEIVQAADAMMVARGDLGSEIPYELVPSIQDRMVELGRVWGKPIIVATHMLESMTKNPTPTRAEVTDVAHAAISQADCTMLSGETASGKFPRESVAAMVRILELNEKFITPKEYTLCDCSSNCEDENLFFRREQARAASGLAQDISADALVVFSRHGITAKAVSNCRPTLPILAFVPSEDVARKLSLVWGIVPYIVSFSENPEVTVQRAIAYIDAQKLLKKKSRIVIVSDIRASNEPAMTVQIRHI